MWLRQDLTGSSNSTVQLYLRVTQSSLPLLVMDGEVAYMSQTNKFDHGEQLRISIYMFQM
jgi:hypothetical protein